MLLFVHNFFNLLIGVIYDCNSLQTISGREPLIFNLVSVASYHVMTWPRNKPKRPNDTFVVHRLQRLCQQYELYWENKNEKKVHLQNQAPPKDQLPYCLLSLYHHTSVSIMFEKTRVLSKYCH